MQNIKTQVFHLVESEGLWREDFFCRDMKLCKQSVIVRESGFGASSLKQSSEPNYRF